MASTIDTSPARTGAGGWARNIAMWLVEPFVAVDEKQRRRLRLVSAYLILMAANAFVGAAVMGQQDAVMKTILLIAGAALFLGYILSRTRYRGAATTIAIGIPAVPVLTMLFLSPGREEFMQQLPWLALPLFVCSLLLSLRSTIIIASVYSLVLSALTFSLGIPATVSAESLAYLIMIIFFVVAITAIRQQDQSEIERRLHECEQAEAALKESEEKFSSAFKTSPIALGIITVADGNFLEVNESLSIFTGYPPEELIGHNHIELNLWVDEGELNQMATDLQEHNRVYNREFRSRRKSGEVRTGLFSAEVININGKPCVILVIADITERKRAEQYQKDENHILTLMSQGTPLKDLLDAILLMGEMRDPSIKASILLVDPVKKILVLAACPSLSEDFKRLLANGLPIGEGVGSCGTAAFRRQRVIVPDIGNNPLFNEKEVIDTTARNNMLSCWSQPIISPGGKLLGTIANYGNKVGVPDEPNLATLEWSARVAAIAIERKRAADALRESEEKFAKAFHASPDIIIISRILDMRIIEVNDSFTRLTGFTRHEVLNEVSTQQRLLGNLGDLERIRILLKDKVSIRNQEVSFLAKRGDVHTLLFSSEPINFGGEPCKITIAKDITELKRAEEELKATMSRLEKSTTQLQASNRELETFSYSVSHDLRSPLRSIDGFSQALLEDYQDRLDDQGRDYLRRLRLASQKMGELIDGLLKLSRLTRSEIHQETIDLGALAQEIVNRLQEEQPERKVEFSASEGMTASGDPQMLRVLLENLIGNAWKFSAKNQHARIEFGKAGDNGGVEFFIRDNGVGFDMAYAGKLFGAFQRLHSAEEFPGTGIGLATVQRIINRHGGTIRAEGEVGKGATFYFTLN